MSGSPAAPGTVTRLLFLGSGRFAVPILEALLARPALEVVGVVGAPDKPVGRHGTPAAVPVVALARERGLPVLQPVRLRTPETAALLAALAPDVGVLADYGRIVPASLLSLPGHGILNVHPSLLPRHRGAAPIPGAILAGDAETGVTIIRMDEGIDTGPTVASTSWPLDGTETAPVLEARAAAEGAHLVVASIAPWVAGRLPEQPQDEARASLTRPLRREDGRIDPARPVQELERQIRALQPWPGSWLETVVGRLVVWRAEAVPEFEAGDAVPGRFGRFGLHVSDGHLALREVQPAGGRRMSWDEFVRGHPAVVGSEMLR